MREIRYLQALNEALHLEMERDERIFMLGEDIRGNMRGEAKGLLDRFGPERVMDTPVSEAAFTGFATGAAIADMRPVVEFQVASLMYVAFDQIVNQAAKLRLMLGGQVNLPITYILMATGASKGMAGQHSDNPYPFFVHGGIKAVCPSSPYDAKGLTITAIREDDPVAIFAPSVALATRGPVPEEAFSIPLGVGETKRQGSDVTVVAVGHLVRSALIVAEELDREGISVEVWDPRTLFPLDKESLCASIAKTGRVVIFDDSNRSCGYAAEVSSVVAERCFSDLKAPIRRITRADVPIPFSLPLESACLPTPDRLADVIRATVAF